MAARTIKLRVRKQLKQSRRKVEKIGTRTGDKIDRNFVRRLGQLTNVRRFIATWLLLVLLLIGLVIVQISGLTNYYQHLAPQPGGVYNEGILGDFTNANPVYATAAVDNAVSRLVFSGLFRYNDKNALVGDLASDWSVNSIGTVYTVHLKPNIRWQDGTALTSSDIVFTYQVIQNPDAESPLLASWQNIKVEAPDDYTVTFTLPNPLSSFPYSLTNGIIPRHILGSIDMSEMRSNTFNTLHPVGTGPFVFKAIEASGNTPETKLTNIELLPYAHYWNGQPKLNEFVVRAYHDQKALLTSFRKQELTSIAGLSDVPDDLKKDSGVKAYSFPLTAELMVFFRTSSGIFSDPALRQALVKASDTFSIIDKIGYSTIAVREPLLSSQIGFNPAYTQFNYDAKAAADQLTSDGWVLEPNGIRSKNGQELKFTLSVSANSEYVYVAHSLIDQWRAIGVNAQISAQDDTDLQNTVNYHSYDALLYGISVGVDPDVFVYWDSTQSDPRSPIRLNFSEYRSTVVDDSLEAGRTRTSPALRIIKYKPFLQAWQKDAPALGLYQPRFLYITRGPVFGLNEHIINNGVDRYTNVENWEIRQSKVTD